MIVRENGSGGSTLSEVDSFEDLYIELRQREGRLYTDEEVALLPYVAREHLYKNEWKLRAQSCKRLTRYLSGKSRPLTIVELGCGNGWLAHRLSHIPASQVIGLDVNLHELEQATRVFAHIPNLSFLYGDLSSVREKADVLVLASSIQYFESLPALIEAGLDCLHQSGELHILDSNLYPEDAVHLAQIRAETYFRTMGVPKMSRFYFHHSMKALYPYRYEVLYNPQSLLYKYLSDQNPFYWIRIKKKR